MRPSGFGGVQKEASFGKLSFKLGQHQFELVRVSSEDDKVVCETKNSGNKNVRMAIQPERKTKALSLQASIRGAKRKSMTILKTKGERGSP